MPTATTDVDVMAELAKLTERRDKIAQHLDTVEAGVREAVADLQQAQEQLGRLEAEAAAGSVTAKDRAQVEAALDKAQARRNEPWPERLEGARQALRDADRARYQFAADHVDELIAHAEQQAEPQVARVNELAVELDQAITQINQASSVILQQLALAGIRPDPNAIAPMRTDDLHTAVRRFTSNGGQPPVVLNRRYVPALANRDAGEAA